MIASVVATLHIEDKPALIATLEAMELREEIEIGVRHANRLPLVIEAADAQDLETITRWLQDLESVLFVDVVFSSCESIAESE